VAIVQDMNAAVAIVDCCMTESNLLVNCCLGDGSGKVMVVVMVKMVVVGNEGGINEKKNVELKEMCKNRKLKVGGNRESCWIVCLERRSQGREDGSVGMGYPL